MIAREVPVQDVLRVVLQSGTQNLEEVVVTAIGMKKQEKALGYAASTVTVSYTHLTLPTIA